METMGAMLKVIYDTVRDASLKADSGDRAAYQTESIIQQAKEILRVHFKKLSCEYFTFSNT